MKLKTYMIKKFTLIELVVSMAVFTVLMLILLQFFSSAQKAWLTANSRAMTYENARVAMDLISRDLQGMLYNDSNTAQGAYPFWYQSNSRVNFIASTVVRPSTSTSPICEIRYKQGVNDGAGGDTYPGWLLRSVSGDDVTANYDFASNPRSVGGTGRVANIFGDGSSSNFQPVVPYVVSLQFSCYSMNAGAMVQLAPDAANSTPLPLLVTVQLTLMDRDAWKKWVAMGGDATNPTGDSGVAQTYRTSNQRVFTRSVYIGNRQSN